MMAHQKNRRGACAIEAMEPRMLFSVTIDVEGAGDISSYAGVGFRLQPIAYLTGLVNNVADINSNDYQVTIIWGDGASSPGFVCAQPHVDMPNSLLIKGSHTYANAASIEPITVNVKGPQGISSPANGPTTFASVDNMPFETLAPGAEPPADRGAAQDLNWEFLEMNAIGDLSAYTDVEITQYVGSISASFDRATASDSNAADYRAFINWGDSLAWEVDDVRIQPNGTGFPLVQGSHTYANPGTYDVTVYGIGPDGISNAEETTQVIVTNLPMGMGALPDADTTKLANDHALLDAANAMQNAAMNSHSGLDDALQGFVSNFNSMAGSPDPGTVDPQDDIFDAAFNAAGRLFQSLGQSAGANLQKMLDYLGQKLNLLTPKKDSQLINKASAAGVPNAAANMNKLLAGFDAFSTSDPYAGADGSGVSGAVVLGNMFQGAGPVVQTLINDGDLPANFVAASAGVPLGTAQISANMAGNPGAELATQIRDTKYATNAFNTGGQTKASYRNALSAAEFDPSLAASLAPSDPTFDLSWLYPDTPADDAIARDAILRGVPVQNVLNGLVPQPNAAAAAIDTAYSEGLFSAPLTASGLTALIDSGPSGATYVIDGYTTLPASGIGAFKTGQFFNAINNAGVVDYFDSSGLGVDTSQFVQFQVLNTTGSVIA